MFKDGREAAIQGFNLSEVHECSDPNGSGCKACMAYISPVESIVLAREYGISEWLLPSYIRLCDNSALSIEEANQLGIETAMKIALIREKVLLLKIQQLKKTFNAQRGCCLNGTLNFGLGTKTCNVCSQRAQWVNPTIAVDTVRKMVVETFQLE